MSPFTEHRLPGAGLAIRAVSWGPEDATPIVLLHGLRAYAHWFDDFAEAAGDRYRIIALDQRGRGLSDWATDGAYHTEAYVADLQAVAQGLGLSRFVLAGHSMGGTNALAFTTRYPAMVSALIVIDSAPELDPRGIARIGLEMAATPAHFASIEAARAFLRPLHARATARSFETRLHWMLKPQADGLVWRIDPAIFDAQLKPDPAERGWARLAALRCPTLFLRGAESDLVSRAVAERMAALVARSMREESRLEEIPGAAHMIVEDNPAAFNDTVLRFLARIGA